MKAEHRDEQTTRMPVDITPNSSNSIEAPVARTPLRHLFASFAGIGAVMFGGGYAMLPLLEREVVDRRRWCSHDEMAECYALAQIIPGVIAVNIAMLIGSRHRGIPGALVAALATVTAPFLTILAIAMVFQRLAGAAAARAVFAGMRPAVAGLLLAAAWGLLKRGCSRAAAVALAAAAAAMLLSRTLGPAGLILAGVAAGVGWQTVAWVRMRRGAPGAGAGGGAA